VRCVCKMAIPGFWKYVFIWVLPFVSAFTWVGGSLNLENKPVLDLINNRYAIGYVDCVGT